MSEEKTTGQGQNTARKVAPAIKVSSPAKKSSIDELYRDNPNEEFAYAPMRSNETSLAYQGLEPVIGKDGKPLNVGNRTICRVVGEQGVEETKRQFEEATEAAKAVRDPKKSSKDKTSVAKKPVKKEDK